MHKGFVLLMITITILGTEQVRAAITPVNLTTIGTAGSHVATSQELAALQCRGKNLPTGNVDTALLSSLGIPENPTAQNDPCLFLQAHANCNNAGTKGTVVRTGTAPACPNGTRTLHIDGLDPAFMKCAMAYIQGYEQKYGSICIADAYRAPGEQACAATPANKAKNGGFAAAPGTSMHEKGLALDLNPAGGDASYDTMHAFARSVSGVGFTVPGDNPHLASTGGNCSTAGYVPAGGIQAAGAASIVGASTATNDPFRNLLAGLGLANNFAPTQCPAGSVLQGNTCYPLQGMSAATQPYVSPTNPTQTTNTGATPVGTASTIGGTSNLITPTNVGTATGGTSSSSNTYVDTSGGSQMSVGDMLLNLAYSSSSSVGSAAVVATATLIALNGDIGKSTGELADNSTNKNTNTTVDTTCVSSTLGGPCVTDRNTALSNSVSMQPVGQNTFTSSDLAGSPSTMSGGTGQTSTFGIILETLKTVLLKILDYLRPFGGVNPNVIRTPDMSIE